ncbi:hypothetical protein NQZ79_g6986 [Umbelopsis isabellina]|nr:hypothetical protein NQZ79_g6986 [Umbelopsis isabellina]
MSMKNTLAVVDPADGHVTSIVAENVTMDIPDVPLNEKKDKSDAEVAEEWDKEAGHVAPVVIDGSEEEIMRNPKAIRKVVLIDKAENALINGSGRIADNMVRGGYALASRITRGTKGLESQIKPSDNPVTISDDTRIAIEKVGDTTASISRGAAKALDRAISATMKGVNTLYEHTKEPEDENSSPKNGPPSDAKRLGQSALKAIATVLHGTGIAAGAVGDSARVAMVDLIRRKYGPDAGYVAARTLHVTGNLVGMLVYFDARGISRQVIVRGTKSMHPYNHKKKEDYSDSDSSSDEDEKPKMRSSMTFPVGAPPPYPPRPGRSRSVDESKMSALPSSTPPPYPPRPTTSNKATVTTDENLGNEKEALTKTYETRDRDNDALNVNEVQQLEVSCAPPAYDLDTKETAESIEEDSTSTAASAPYIDSKQALGIPDQNIKEP